jgi:hypothetical protein
MFDNTFALIYEHFSPTHDNQVPVQHTPLVGKKIKNKKMTHIDKGKKKIVDEVPTMPVDGVTSSIL